MLWPISFSFFTVEMTLPITLQTYTVVFLLFYGVCMQRTLLLCLSITHFFGIFCHFSYIFAAYQDFFSASKSGLVDYRR